LKHYTLGNLYFNEFIPHLAPRPLIDNFPNMSYLIFECLNLVNEKCTISSWWVIGTVNHQNMYSNTMWMRFIFSFPIVTQVQGEETSWVEECFLFIFFISIFLDKCKPKNSKLSGIYTWKINSKSFPISLWKNGKVSLGTSTWSFLGQTNSWVMREDSCTFGKYHVNYTHQRQTW